MKWTLVLIFLSLMCSPCLAQGPSVETRGKLARVLERESEQKWKAVQWAPSADAAVARARRENKPLLVFIVVGQRGQPHATTC